MSFKVIGIGEVLWDLLPSGPQMGGAPANFAYHAHALGARSQVITRVGNDKYGLEIKRRLAEMDLSNDLVQTDGTHPTGTVTVTLSQSGIPEYSIHEDVAWDHIAAGPEALGAVVRADAVCFGSLAQRNVVSRQSIKRILAATPKSALRIFDINLRQQFFHHTILAESLEMANVLKLNDTELPVLTGMFGEVGSIKHQVEVLAEKFSLRLVALTCGAEGSLLFQGGRWSKQNAEPVLVEDTVGAGDSFTAALCLGLLRGLDLDEINLAANKVAAFVCSHSGATPHLPESLIRLLDSSSKTPTPVNSNGVATTA